MRPEMERSTQSADLRVFHSSTFPTFTFIGADENACVLRLAQEIPRIRGVANHLKARLPARSVVGLMYPSQPNLILNWLACLAADLRPLIMQYPTSKQSRLYWSDSVRHSVETATIAAVICDQHSAALGLGNIVQTITQAELETAAPGGSEPLDLRDFEILQLSSGTTGHRKAVQFDSSQLRKHVTDFNEVLGLGEHDRIVSWLPLYHDMGYIACLVMPLVLGIDVIMMDPITWVKRPELLYNAIDKFSGTVCYMPNFGFEVMARSGSRRLPSMRWWISCSEPVSADTARKFISATSAPPETFAPCYAMAENIFAVSIRRGLQTSLIDDVPVVSCGHHIPGVDLKIVDSEIWVRSPTSLRSYLGGTDIRDAEGYYPTGDLGELIEGEVHVTGRKHDLLIQAGRKYMLSDIDLTLNRHFPEVRGRAAAIALMDERLGTQKPVVLIESEKFFLRTDQASIAQELKTVIGLDQIEVHFVPPKFLTKTSSGKFNRKESAKNWLLAQNASSAPTLASRYAADEIKASFPTVDWGTPVTEVLDSLSITVLRIILAETRVGYRDDMTLAQIVRELESEECRPAGPERDVIRIVSLAHKGILTAVTEQHLNRLGELLGCPVTFEHIALPPSPVVLSDAIFHDWFEPRLDRTAFVSVDRAFSKLRGASLILVDDIAEMYFPPAQTYGALSHNLERDPRADLIVVRWQRYAQFHHKLPLTFVAGSDLALEHRTAILDLLAAYLRKPIFRIATKKAYEELTAGWELRRFDEAERAPRRMDVLDPDDVVTSIAGWARQLSQPLERFSATDLSASFETADLAHYCSGFVNKEKVDVLLSKFRHFCIVGQDSSVPYIKAEIERQGKSYITVRSFAPEVLESVKDHVDCVIVCGAQGEYSFNIPAAAMMRPGEPWHTQHIQDPEIANARFRLQNRALPASGTDWFYLFDFDRSRSRAVQRTARLQGQEMAKVMRERRAERRNKRQVSETELAQS